jgi:hypothetical protein
MAKDRLHLTVTCIGAEYTAEQQEWLRAVGSYPSNLLRPHERYARQILAILRSLGYRKPKLAKSNKRR